jgi:hypothetical protein
VAIPSGSGDQRADLAAADRASYVYKAQLYSVFGSDASALMDPLSKADLHLPSGARLYSEDARVRGKPFTRIKAGPFTDYASAKTFCRAFDEERPDGVPTPRPAPCLIVKGR